ncbi:MAG: ComF family protein [Clostridia bacterium]|nr:ComF family protein [Clostridia bacterium]
MSEQKQKIKERWNVAKEWVLNLVFPKNIKCMVCGRDLKKASEIEFCDNCLSQMEVITDKCCEKCGAKLVAEEKFCLNCQAKERHFDIGRSCYVFDNSVRHLIHQLKFGNKPYIARAFAPMMRDKLQQLNWEYDVIIPVPLYPKHKKERGYNQSEKLAKELVKLIDKPIDTTSLIKVKDTSKQLGLGYADRLSNLDGAFKVVDKANIKGKSILLIDDVMTTGATANACSEVLRNAKASEIKVLTVAHGVVKLPTEDGEKVENLEKDTKKIEK